MTRRRNPTSPSSGDNAGVTCDSTMKNCPHLVTVVIKDKNGVDPPCRFIPRNKTQKFKALGAPEGGSYTWSVGGWSHASIANGANAQIVEVRGDLTSAVVDDCILTVKYTQGGNSATDTARLTVFEFTEIMATILPTPAETGRVGIPAPANHTFRNANKSEDFGVNEPLVLIRNSRAGADIQLEVTCLPAGLPIHWYLERNPADHANLGGAGDLPTLNEGEAASRAILGTDQKGSFRIRAFLDCRGGKTYRNGMEFMPLHLVLADATIVADNSVAQPTKLQATANDAGGVVDIENGMWNAGLAGAGMRMELTADVTGGGADGRLGLDRVFAGLINNLARVDIRSTYGFPTGIQHNFDWVYADNVDMATGNYGGRSMYRPLDPAPRPYTWPLLDSGRPNAGNGGNTATMGGSNVLPPNNRPVGQRWTIQCMDSPSRSFPYQHPVVAAATLQRIHYVQQFTANFCFWTNHARAPGATGDPADRLYAVILTVEWEIEGGWRVTVNAAGAAVLAVTTVHNIRTGGRTPHTPIIDVELEPIEVRPPSGIGMNPVNGARSAGWDART